MRKQSKMKISVIQRKIWELCKQIIRENYPHTCYTCGAKNLEGANLQTGHMLAKASLGAFLKYDLRLLRPQCSRCNLWLGGMGAVFIENMRKIEGNRYVNKILYDRNIIVKAYDHYESVLEEYQKLSTGIPLTSIS